MAKSSKLDPLEAAKITDEKAASDKAALGTTMHVDPTRPTAPVEPGQFVPPEEKGPPPPALRTDGPSIEEWVGRGEDPAAYPPDGFAERPTAGLTLHKAGSPIPQDLVEQTMFLLSQKDKAPAKRQLYVVTADGRASVGKGQIAFFRKGTQIDHAGYGDVGIQRLIDGGIKLELIEEK